MGSSHFTIDLYIYAFPLCLSYVLLDNKHPIRSSWMRVVNDDAENKVEGLLYLEFLK